MAMAIEVMVGKQSNGEKKTCENKLEVAKEHVEMN